MPETVTAQVNLLGQGHLNDLDLIDCKKLPIGELEITGVDGGETEAPHIALIEPKTDIGPISDGTETLPELVQRQIYPLFHKNKIWVSQNRMEP